MSSWQNDALHSHRSARHPTVCHSHLSDCGGGGGGGVGGGVNVLNIGSNAQATCNC